MFRSIYLTGFMFSLALSLSGCGNSGGNQTAGIDGSGAPVATTTSGTIDGFGSVIVNGAIEQINASSNSVMLLGQQVYITNNTIFDSAISPKNITGLAVGNKILVSGSLTIDGNVSATRIDVVSANQIQLSGFIRELDESDSSFKLNQQQVKFAAAQLVNVDNNRLQNGMLVSVTGVLDDSKQLHATRIATINPHLPHSIKKADVEGFITRFVSTTDFDVAGTGITTNAQTRYENGNVTYLLPGAKIVAKGTIDNAGKLVAEKIEFEPRSNNKISGTVTSLQIANNSGIVTGQLELDGTLIQTSINTRYEDKGHSH
ncbi:MAG: hypothetical protein K0Q78_26, partial [Cellvibrio sp.]|nr:hypothetical protein [Cellvibrio sp.]